MDGSLIGKRDLGLIFPVFDRENLPFIRKKAFGFHLIFSRLSPCGESLAKRFFPVGEKPGFGACAEPEHTKRREEPQGFPPPL